MKFDDCIEHILKWEGGYTNHPDDPGGETKFGIAKKFYPHLDIKNITREQAIEIYKKDYWQKNSLDDFPIYLRLPYFDCVVNQGPGAAVKLLQRALGIKPDMKFGPKTKDALMKSGPEIVQQFLAERLLHYASLESFYIFGKGWSRRLIDTTLETGKRWPGVKTTTLKSQN